MEVTTILTGLFLIGFLARIALHRPDEVKERWQGLQDDECGWIPTRPKNDSKDGGDTIKKLLEAKNKRGYNDGSLLGYMQRRAIEEMQAKEDAKFLAVVNRALKAEPKNFLGLEKNKNYFEKSSQMERNRLNCA